METEKKCQEKAQICDKVSYHMSSRRAKVLFIDIEYKKPAYFFMVSYTYDPAPKKICVMAWEVWEMVA